MVGSAAGDVWGINYARKVLVGRPGRKGKGAWLGKVLGVDWRVAQEGEGVVQGDSEDVGDGNVNRDAEVGGDGQARMSEEDAEQGKKDLFHGPPTRKGVSRLTFGFKPEAVDLGRNPGRRAKNGKGNKGKKARGGDYEDEGLDDVPLDGDGDVEMLDGADAAAKKQTKGAKKGKAKDAKKQKVGDDVDVTGAEVIFEEEQAVTVMEWNVNRHTAGWAAIGWGSGLLMVRDLSVDI